MTAAAAAAAPIARTAPTLDTVIRTVAAACGVSMAAILSPRRDARLVRARHLAMWLCRRTTSASYPQIGRAFGERDHTTIIHGVTRTTETMAGDPVFAEQARGLLASLTGAAPGD